MTLVPSMSICDPLSENVVHCAFYMKIEIRPKIGIPMCNCVAGKKWKWSVAWFPSYRAKCIMDATFRENAMFLRCYGCFHILLCYTCACKKAAWKLTKTVGKDIKAGAYIVSMDRKTTVYGVKSHFLKNAYKLSIATRSRISLACLWVQAYIVVIKAELGFIIQYDTVQASCDTLV